MDLRRGAITVISRVGLKLEPVDWKFKTMAGKK